MQTPDIIIAVDGGASTGKSTFARSLAAELGFQYLDSGAIYRCVTHFALQRKLIDSSGAVSPELENVLGELDFSFSPEGHACIDGKSVERSIRSLKVSSRVSVISALPYVRRFVDEILHRLGSCGRLVMDGRDIGTTVFPNAELKIFVTASEQVRAKRRYDEMLSKGETPTMEEVLANLRERDYIDSHRATSPLRKADDAFVLDNSDLTVREEIIWTLGLIRGKFGIL